MNVWWLGVGGPQGLKPSIYGSPGRRGWKPRPFKNVYETTYNFKSKLFCPVTSVTLPPDRRAGYFQEGFPQAFAMAIS
jgi:hypothetical protein